MQQILSRTVSCFHSARSRLRKRHDNCATSHTVQSQSRRFKYCKHNLYCKIIFGNIHQIFESNYNIDILGAIKNKTLSEICNNCLKVYLLYGIFGIKKSTLLTLKSENNYFLVQFFTVEKRHFTKNLMKTTTIILKSEIYLSTPTNQLNHPNM